MNYTIDKTHIDQLTPEQKQKLQELYPPKVGQQIITGKTGKNYVIQKIMRDGKLDVGSFKTWPSNVFPVLTESDLIHSIAANYKEFTIKKMEDEQLPFDNISWNVATVHDGETLVDALWEAYKALVLS